MVCGSLAAQRVFCTMHHCQESVACSEVVLFVMLAGTPPFHSDDDVELMKKVKKAFAPQKSCAQECNPRQPSRGFYRELTDLRGSGSSLTPCMFLCAR